LGRLVGWIFVCIDNIGVWHVDPDQKKLWHERLQCNATHFGLAPFKEELHWDETNCEFIGIHYSNGRWRHADDRMKRWRSRYGPPGCQTTEIVPLGVLNPKDLQRIAGVFSWDLRVRRSSMEPIRRLYDMQYKACANAPELPSQADWEWLKRYWADFQKNPFQEWVENVLRPLTSYVTIVIASDASGGPEGRWSFVQLIDGKVTMKKKKHRNPSGTFPADVGEAIYYRELYAALMTVQDLNKRGIRGAQLILVID